MKAIYILGVAACIAGCSLTETERPIQNSFLVDVSDSITPEIRAFEKGGVGLPAGDIWTAHFTRYGVISNTEYARMTMYTLESDVMYIGNEYERKAEVKEYTSKLQTLRHNDSIEYEGSLIWAPLMHELELLGEDSMAITTIYLVSDLLENNSWINFYDPKTRRLLKEDPESIRKVFHEKVPEIKYTGHMELVLVHEPYLDTKENEFYSLIVEQIYRPIFTELGIKLSVRTSI